MTEDKSRLNRLKDKYRLIIYNDNTFQEVWSYKLSRLNVFSLFSAITMLVIVIVFLLIAFTPLKVYVIPGYPKEEERMKSLEVVLRADSMLIEMQKQRQWSENILTILNGGSPKSYYEDTTVGATPYDNISFTRSKEDSMLRAKVEEEEAYNLNLFDANQNKNKFSELYFFPPVKGIVTNSFAPGIGHYATDIVASMNATVHAVLDGTVILSSWTIETGHVMQIQHKNDLISTYKHNKEVLKKVGDKVKAGDAIAIVGNTGELTSGPHLHFELWHKGEPVNSEDLIVYE